MCVCVCGCGCVCVLGAYAYVCVCVCVCDRYGDAVMQPADSCLRVGIGRFEFLSVDELFEDAPFHGKIILKISKCECKGRIAVYLHHPVHQVRSRAWRHASFMWVWPSLG